MYVHMSIEKIRSSGTFTFTSTCTFTSIRGVTFRTETALECAVMWMPDVRPHAHREDTKFGYVHVYVHVHEHVYVDTGRDI